MSTVSIIGTGNMGTAIASVVTAAGHDVEVVGRDPEQQISGVLVVLAVPGHAQAEVVATHGAKLAGKAVVEISNPVNFETFDSLTVPADSSAAAQLAIALPQSKVLKAFNTNFAATLAAKRVGDLPTTVLIAGDDADAKATLAAIVTGAGLDAVDVGSLRRARELEALGFIQLGLAVGGTLPWTGGFALVR